jgi:hypothetical protein
MACQSRQGDERKSSTTRSRLVPQRRDRVDQQDRSKGSSHVGMLRPDLVVLELAGLLASRGGDLFANRGVDVLERLVL